MNGLRENESKFKVIFWLDTNCSDGSGSSGGSVDLGLSDVDYTELPPLGMNEGSCNSQSGKCSVV